MLILLIDVGTCVYQSPKKSDKKDSAISKSESIRVTEFGGNWWIYRGSENSEVSEFSALICNQGPLGSGSGMKINLPKDDSVRIEMYDQEGKAVDQPYRRLFAAGEYRVFWQPHDIPSGAYLCRITTSDTTISSKFILIR